MSDPADAPTARGEAVALLRTPRFLAVISITSMLPLSVAVVSPALPGLASGLGVSDARIGLVVTAITLPPMLLAPVVGVASDLLGRRTVALPGLFLFGLAGVAVTVVDSFPVILGLRGLQGIAMAGIGPLSVTLLGDLYRGSVRTTAQGIRSSTGGLVLVVVPIIAGALAGLAWQYPFYLYGAAFLALVFVYRFVPETAGDMATESSLRGTLRTYAGSVASEFGDPSLVVVMLGGFVRFFSLFAFLTFVPIFAVRSLGASSFLAGLIVAMAGIRILISPTAGWWVSRFSRRWTLLASLAIQVVVFALMPFAQSLWILAALAVCYGAGDALMDPVINDATTSMVAAHNRNGIVGGLRVLKETGKTAAPVVLGVVLAVAGYLALFSVLATALGAYAVAVVLFLGAGSRVDSASARA